MKLLTDTTDYSEALQMKLFFESKGIPVFVSNENMRGAFGPAFFIKHEIFTIHEHQYQDALSLLQNEDHEVESPIDLNEYQNFIEENDESVRNTAFNSVMNVVVSVAIGLVVLILFLVYMSNA